MINIHIGIDDVDSINGGCTTHYAVLLAWELRRRGYLFTDYPNLVRLNPAVPWKTRGNGAVALRLSVPSESDVLDIWELARNTLEEYTGLFQDPKKQPGLILHTGDIPWEYKWLAEKALYDIIPLDLAQRVLMKHPETRVYNSRKRGLIGALSAIGYTMQNTDYTYELLAYRKQEYWGRERQVDEMSIIEVDRLYHGELILNYDYDAQRPLITPRGPDPVLLGLRGENPHILLEAFRKIVIHEPVEYIAIYRTNQHTDAHLHRVDSLCNLRPYMCVVVEGVVSSKPTRIPGGHVVFKLCSGECCIDVAVYEPTKKLRDVVEELVVGDRVEVMGCSRPPSSKHGLTLNLEKIRIVELVELVEYVNPKCPVCRSTMESMGRGKGYRCRKCGYRDPRAVKTPIIKPRKIKPGIYQPPPSAFKHLMKPIERIGREKTSFNGVEIEEFIVKLS